MSNQPSLLQRALEAYPDFVIRHRILVLLACFALTALAATGIPKLYLSDDYRYFFSADNPQLLDFNALENTYTKNDNVMFVLAPKNGDVFTAENLAMVEDWTKEGWQLPHSIRVDSITNFQNTEAFEDDLLVADLVSDAEELSPDEIERVRRIALAEPNLINRLIPPDSAVTGINVTLQMPGESNQESTEVADYANALKERMQKKYPETDVYITGITMLSYAFYDSSMKDAVQLIPVMYLVIIIFMLALLRSWIGTLITVFVIAMSCTTALGLYGYIGQTLSGPSAQAPTVIMTLAVADCVHVLITLLESLKKGQSKEEAIRTSLHVNIQPVFLTSLTTAFGFLCMNFSDVPSFRDLGNITAMGMGAAFLFAVLFLPAAASMLPLRAGRQVSSGAPQMEALANFVIRNQKRLFWGFITFFIVVASFIPKNELNDEFISYFDERIQFRRDTNFVLDNLTGLYLMDYSLGTDESGGVNDPEYLETLAAFSDWYRAQPEVIHVNTFSDTIKRLNMSLHGDDPEWYRIPTSRELSAQYLLLYELSLPYGLDVNNQINIDKSATRFTVTTTEISSKDLRALALRARGWLDANAPPSMAGHAVGTCMMFAYISQRNIKTMLTGTTVAAILISLSLILALRSVRFGLLSLVPNLVPAAMGFGVWGIFVGQVGLGLSVVSALTLGIIVDDTIHFLSKYLRARREQNLDPEDAIRYAFRSVGRALIITSTILVGGFLVLAFSAFQLNADLGKLTAITIGFALIADLFFLPTLIIRTSSRIPLSKGDSQ